MVKIILDRENNNKCFLISDKLELIREHFSSFNPAAKYGRSPYIPKRLYAITPMGQFDIGLVEEIKKHIINYPDETLEIEEDVIKRLKPSLNKQIIDRLKLSLRDYQQDAVHACMSNGRGLAVLATAAGKTLVSACLIENYYLYSENLQKFKCLVIVPDIGLVEQTYSDYVEYGVTFKVGKWSGDNKLDSSCNVIIANSAILQRRFLENSWIKDVDLLVIDEVHRITKGSQISKVVESITTDRKFGFTGTLPEDVSDRWNVLGKVGPVLIQKKSSELRKRDILTNAEVKIFKIDYLDDPPYDYKVKGQENYMIELDFIYKSIFRNYVIQSTCKSFNKNILILVNHLVHGDLLYSILSNKFPDREVVFIKGDVSTQDRDKAKQMMEKRNNVICVAMSSIFSTGVNIKNIHMIIFAALGKSFTRVVQSIGRGLRKHKDKNKLIIIDIADKLRFGTKHYMKRKTIYTSEQIEFKEIDIKEKL
jgi:superfamily II DNA or RNA helicase